MIVHFGLDDLTDCRGGFVSIGNFDGVHRGHQAMMHVLVEHARSVNCPAVVLTFEPHPITLLRPEAVPPRLSSLDSKTEWIRQCGVDAVVVYPTDLELLKLSPEEFFERIILEQFDARGLVEGPNFYFGKDRSGDVETLRRLCEMNGKALVVVPPVEFDGDLISSSRIRRMIADGRLGDAVQSLGHPYRVSGVVVRGSARGRSLGFPTANLGDVTTLLPADGVYAGKTSWNETAFATAVHIGPNPTFCDSEQKVEAHLLDFEGELYGESITIDLIDRVRSVQTFADVNEFKQQLERDLNAVRRIIDR